MAQVGDLIDQALDNAALQHFAKLFDTMMSADHTKAETLERFERGLRKLIANYYKTAELIAELKAEPTPTPGV